MRKKFFTAFVFTTFFFAGVFAAQDGLDISSPSEAEKNAELEITGFEEQYGNKNDFSYTGDEEKKNPAANPKPAKQSAAKTLEHPKGSLHKPLLADRIDSVKKKFKTGKSDAFFKSVLKYWKEVKDFVSNLPGIRHYRNSIYSGENYKKEVGKFSNEYKPHLQKDSQGAKMLKEGAKEF
jgi:hypothetical protein